jgi:hypothetical protein
VISTVLSKYLDTSLASPDFNALTIWVKEMVINDDKTMQTHKKSRYFFMEN